MKNQAQFFPDLDMDILKDYVSRWAKENHPLMIEKICLYQGTIEVECSYVIVATVKQCSPKLSEEERRQILDTDDPRFDVLNYYCGVDPNCLHIMDALPYFYKIAHRLNSSGEKILKFDAWHEWIWWTVEPGDDDPPDFVIEDNHWVLFKETPQQVEAIELPVFPAESQTPEPEQEDISLQQTEGSGEDFIKNLTLGFENNSEIFIRVPKKARKHFTAQTIGFRDDQVKTWKMFIGVLQERLPFYRLGPSCQIIDGQKVEIKTYQAKRKLLDEVNRIFLAFFRKEYQLTIPSDYKVYERNEAEGPGVYRFKFGIETALGVQRNEAKDHYAHWSDEKIEIEFYNLIDQGREYPDDQDLKSRVNELFYVAKSRQILSEKDLTDVLEPETEQYKYDPFENRRNSPRY